MNTKSVSLPQLLWCPPPSQLMTSSLIITATCICIYNLLNPFIIVGNVSRADHLVLDNPRGSKSPEKINYPIISSHWSPVILHLVVGPYWLSPAQLVLSTGAVIMLGLFDHMVRISWVQFAWHILEILSSSRYPGPPALLYIPTSKVQGKHIVPLVV